MPRWSLERRSRRSKRARACRGDSSVSDGGSPPCPGDRATGASAPSPWLSAPPDMSGGVVGPEERFGLDANDGGEQRRKAVGARALVHGLNTFSTFNPAKRVSFRPPPTAVRVSPARRGKAGAAILVAADRLQLRVGARRVVEDGATRARTDARLGAIQALSRLEFVLFPGLSRPAAASFCDQLPPDYQGIPGYLVTGSASCDQIRHRGRRTMCASGRSRLRPPIGASPPT